MPDPQAGKIALGLRISLLWQNFCSIIASGLQVAHPVGKGLVEQYIRKKKKILQNQSLELGWFSAAK